MNHRDHETILGMMATTPDPILEDGPLVLDDLTNAVELHRQAILENNRLLRAQNEALKTLAEQGVQTLQEMVGVMQMMWAEHNATRRH